MSFIPIGKVKTFCSQQHQSHQSHSWPHSHVRNLHQSLEFLREEFCFPIQSPSPPHPYSAYLCLQRIVIFNWLVFSHNKVRRWMGHCWPTPLLWWNNHLFIASRKDSISLEQVYTLLLTNKSRILAHSSLLHFRKPC